MKEIKKMLLGIAIMLAVIVFHLFMEDGFLPDLIAIIGLIIVVAGYISKGCTDKPTQ
ncbi:MAG: hypothetical protein IKM66_06325 [Clostridia bacterium]|nr:hypothetical protein [Clostridia bacterium]